MLFMENFKYAIKQICGKYIFKNTVIFHHSRQFNTLTLLPLTFTKHMVKVDSGTTLTTLRRLRNRYRLVVMNDDTYEEVVTFKLSRLSVYIVLSSIFVILYRLNSCFNCFYSAKTIFTRLW